jgi:cell division protein FtsZ
LQALKGVEEIEKNVDALLVINNERLLDIYSDLTLEEGFKKADDTLTIAAKSIAEIITIPGIINVDFADVNTTLKEGGVAIMSSGLGKGESRVSAAIENALNSPLLNNNDIIKAKKILLNISFSSTHPLMMEEMKEVHRFMAKFSSGIKVIWGTAKEEKLDENVKITILATGFGIENISLDKEVLEAHASISDIEAIKAREEEERRKEEEERKRLIMKYYPGETAISILRGTSIRPKPFIFTFENIDDNETIEALINHPTYNRSTQVMFDIAKKAEARRADYVEEVKGETEDNKTEEEKQETIFNF